MGIVVEGDGELLEEAAGRELWRVGILIPISLTQ
jgi:hypothetical protein